MRHDHLKRELELMLLLTQNRQYSVGEICERLGISRRTFYYYIEFFELAGFMVEKHDRLYSLNRMSKFFTQIYELVQFTDDEALLMRQLIENAGMESGRLRALHARLDSFFDFKILENEELQLRTAGIRNILYKAIKQRKMVMIGKYSSPNSRTEKSRLVEPFLFMNNNKDVRCYELPTQSNKTFRLSRMDDVAILDREWENEGQHRQVFTDIFSFSGETTMTVSLLMGQLSHNVMLEEYPESAPCFAQQADGKWLFKTSVCSYLGIGRFVLGMFDDMEIIGDKGLRDYVKGKVTAWNEKAESTL